MRIRFPIACLSVLLVAGAAAAGLLTALEKARPKTAAEAEAPWLPPAAAVKPLFLGYHALAADLFWIRTVQYFGAHIQTDRQYPYLYRLVDLTTSLDPHFLDAYQLGGLFLSIGRAYPEAIAIYRKGIEHNPDRWELPHDLGRLYFLELYDYPQALRWWELTDRLPSRPHYIPRFVARLHARMGQVETALELWTQAYNGATNEWIREIARKEIEKLRKQLRTG
jgi:tetratricopeptide (TPR) repeat protein